MARRLKSLLLFIILCVIGVVFICEYGNSSVSLLYYGLDVIYHYGNRSHLNKEEKLEHVLHARNEIKPEASIQLTLGKYNKENIGFSLNGTFGIRRPVTAGIGCDIENSEAWITPKDKSVPKDHVRRIQTLKQRCMESITLRRREQKKANLSEFFYSRHHGFAYCKVPKSGSTFWMKVFMVLGKGENYSRQISRMSRTEIHDRSRTMIIQPSRIMRKNIPTIIVSRNPFSRLYSAYVDKVYMPLFWEQFSRMENVRILNSYRLNGTVEVMKSSKMPLPDQLMKYRDSFLEKGLLIKKNVSHLITPVCVNNASFEDFLKFIISEIESGRPLEPHWAPVSHLCHPCKFNSHKIVKQESFVSDVEHALQSVGVDLNKCDWLKRSLKENRSENSVPSIVAVIENKLKRKAVSSCIGHTTVVERLWKSFQIQGFISDDIHTPSELLLDMHNFNKETVTKAVLNAIARKRLTEAEKMRQRDYYLRRAYQTVSTKTVAAIQDIYYLDFILFDYSANPPD